MEKEKELEKMKSGNWIDESNLINLERLFYFYPAPGWHHRYCIYLTLAEKHLFERSGRRKKQRGKRKSGRFYVYISPLLTSLLSFSLLSSPMAESQGHGIQIPTASSPPSDQDFDHDVDHPDFSPVGSPELTDSLLPPPLEQPLPSVLSDDLRRKIIKQATSLLFFCCFFFEYLGAFFLSEFLLPFSIWCCRYLAVIWPLILGYWIIIRWWLKKIVIRFLELVVGF